MYLLYTHSLIAILKLYVSVIKIWLLFYLREDIYCEEMLLSFSICISAGTCRMSWEGLLNYIPGVDARLHPVLVGSKHENSWTETWVEKILSSRDGC